ncbi:MAG: restriction endonuclease subunit S [Leptospiraceae bacterium]|nr:restriction endonuclease subunit S [Leptospiraceae bacterium]MDW7977122.1 restriction endonuclease subunit S [Leptospiraceae bacterium]
MDYRYKFYIETKFIETSLGEIPQDWETYYLGEKAIFEVGKREKGGSLEKGDILSLGCEHIDNNGNISLKNPKYISSEFFNKMKKGKINLFDILLCKDGAKTGKVAYIKNLPIEKMAINEHLFIIRSKDDDLLNHFLFFVLFSGIGQKQIKSFYHGLIGGINKSQIENLKIVNPPLSEQKAIAYVLSTIQEAKDRGSD